MQDIITPKTKTRLDAIRSQAKAQLAIYQHAVIDAVTDETLAHIYSNFAMNEDHTTRYLVENVDLFEDTHS